jgi:hypothetical protein
MYRTLAGSEGNVLGYQVEGSITAAEVKEMAREVEKTIQTHGKARVLVEVGKLSLPEAKAVWEDMKMMPEYMRDVERFALVGGATWQEWAAKLTNALAKGEARHFDSGDLDKAWAWLKG